MQKNKTRIRLSQNDMILFALEDVLPSMGILITLRFQTVHEVEEIRRAMRHIISIYPKLRSVVEPTLFSYKFRIHDNADEKIDFLFNDAFRVKYNLAYGTPEFHDFRRSFLNEAYSPEQGLPLKIRYLPDTRPPVMLLSVHHGVCDGTSWGHIVNDLMAYLNGKPASSHPLDNPSIAPAFLEKPYTRIFDQFKRSYKAQKETAEKHKGQKIFNPSSRPVNFFSPVDMHHHIISRDEKTILATTKKLGCSIYAFLLTALTMALTRNAGPGSGDLISIIFSIDLRSFFDENRPFFGNYAGAYTISFLREDCSRPKSLMADINAQMFSQMYLFKKKNKLYPMLMKKLFTLIGKKNIVNATLTMKRKGMIQMTYAVSVLGNLNRLNKHGDKALMDEAIATVPHQGLLFTVSSINGKLITNFSYPEAEFTHDEIKAHVAHFEEAMDGLVELV